MNRAAPAWGDASARTLLERHWHSPGTAVIPTDICLALEKGAEFLLSNMNPKTSLSAKHYVREREVRQAQGGSICLISCWLAATPGLPWDLPLPHWGRAPGGSGLHWCPVALGHWLPSLALPDLLSVLLLFGGLIRAWG